MRVFVTGATGWVGSAVTRELLAHGHEVVGLARSDRAVTALTEAGATPYRGSLADPDGLAAAAKDADGVLHLAFDHSFADYQGAGAADLRAVEAMGAALEGTGTPLVVTSGLVFEPGIRGTEDDPGCTASAGSVRVASENATLALADRGVRAIVLRLAASVHGAGDPGFVARLVAVAREKGAAAVVGEGANTWPAVHRSDAARLYRLALESAPAGIRLHAVAEEGIAQRDIAAVIGRHLDVPVVHLTPEQARDHFGWFASFAGDFDARADSARTRALLGWHPTGQPLLTDLEEGHYFA
ncbi:SDR family oxidoreductase [Streptomyces sp. VRA16 Mangrove soil]|uniref:SDR family oxidoreductase n=1 Tax=Streptomyces sp. VRA16 Mangrove soil TaxID=2817434 RepID=UPI001A9D92F2|nr:SDR family oxidoreductase [Streptomyces sp. VRA16 Mangrove soil]MBO1336001.1 SDR family oxidoreductase [Streptomyces sp. VRA16 Mangrove soil]